MTAHYPDIATQNLLVLNRKTQNFKQRPLIYLVRHKNHCWLYTNYVQMTHNQVTCKCAVNRQQHNRHAVFSSYLYSFQYEIGGKKGNYSFTSFAEWRRVKALVNRSEENKHAISAYNSSKTSFELNASLVCKWIMSEMRMTMLLGSHSGLNYSRTGHWHRYTTSNAWAISEKYNKS